MLHVLLKYFELILFFLKNVLDKKLDLKKKELWCYFDKLAFPIKDGIPVMLADDARGLTLDEWEKR